MNYLIFVGILLAQGAYSQELLCNPDAPKASLKATVSPAKNAVVYALERPGTGYRWVSKQGLDPKIEDLGPIDGIAKISFTIGSSDFSAKSKQFVFEYKRPWETKKPESVCAVTVKKDPK